MASKKTVELFYDVLSPYSWIAFEGKHPYSTCHEKRQFDVSFPYPPTQPRNVNPWQQKSKVMCRCRPVWNINVELQPVLLAGIMKASDNTPPGLNPTKGLYLVKDVKRLFEFYELGPVKFPENPLEVLMIKGSLPTMRLLTAAKLSRPETMESLSREFWKRIYRTGEDHVAPESLVEACTRNGLSVAEAEELVEQSNGKEVKEKLKEATQRAIDNGAFGAPIFLVDSEKRKEMFFGSDRFHLIAKCLGVQWPLPDINSKL